MGKLEDRVPELYQVIKFAEKMSEGTDKFFTTQ